MSTQDQEYMKMHLEWSADITGNEEIVIDESVFEEIYRMQEEQDDKERVHEKEE